METTTVFTFTDQPTTCPECGNRTEIILDLIYSPLKTQHHQCLSKNCSFRFIVQTDDKIEV